jgi:hypothetical protein
MKIIVQLGIVILPLIGLLVSRFAVLRVVCAALISSEAFFLGYGLSRELSGIAGALSMGMSGRLSKSDRFLHGGIFAAVVFSITLLIALKPCFRAAMNSTQEEVDNSDEQEEDVVDLPDKIEGLIEPLDPDAEIKRRANSGQL